MVRFMAQFDQKFQFDHQVKQDSIVFAFCADTEDAAQ